MKRITLTVPAEVLTTAKLASQALDNDVGGYYAFESANDSGQYTYTVNVSEEYLQAFNYFKQHPEALLAVISSDFERRFPEAPVPTFADCEAFCAAVILEEVS